MSLEEQTIALAGAFQALELVKQIAKTGLVDYQPFESLIYSTLQLNATTTADVYGGLDGIKTGLHLLRKQLMLDTETTDVSLFRYFMHIMSLERKLMRNDKMLNSIKQAIELAEQQAQNHGISDPIVIETLANAYKNTLSTLKPIIQVTGEKHVLQNPVNANKIRALLLACIRSTVLWRQKGGKRWHFLFSRNKILRTIRCLLDQLEQTSH